MIVFSSTQKAKTHLLTSFSARAVDLYAYIGISSHYDYAKREMLKIAQETGIADYFKRNGRMVRIALWSIIVVLVLIILYPTLFIKPSMPFFFVRPVPVSAIDGTEFYFFAYSSEQTKFIITVNNDKKVVQVGREISIPIRIHGETHIQVTMLGRTTRYRIHALPYPGLKNIHTTIIPPRYLHGIDLALPEGHAVRGSRLVLTANVNDSVAGISLTDGEQMIYRSVANNSVEAAIVLNNESIELSVEGLGKKYPAETMRFTLHDDTVPLVSFINRQETIILNNRAVIDISAFASDDWGLSRWELYIDDMKFAEKPLNGKEAEIRHTISSSPELNGKTMTVRCFDIKGQTAEISVRLIYLTEEQMNDLIVEHTEDVIASHDKAEEDFSAAAEALKRLIEKTKLDGEIDRETKENLQEAVDTMNKLQDQIQKDSAVLNEEQKDFANKVITQEMKQLAEEIKTLLSQTDMRSIPMRSERIDKKIESVEAMMKSFRDALKRLKQTQDLDKLTKTVEATEKKDEITDALKRYGEKYEDPFVRDASEKYLKTHDKNALLQSLKELQKMLNGTANEEVIRTVQDILSVQLAQTIDFEKKIFSGEASSADVLRLSDMLNVNLNRLQMLGIGMMYLHPAVLSLYSTALEAIRQALDNVGRSYEYRYFYDGTIRINTALLQTLAQAEKRSQSMDTEQMLSMVQEILGGQKEITEMLQQGKQNGQAADGSSGLSDSMIARQKELAEKMGQLENGSDGRTQQQSGSIRKDMERSVEEKDPAKKRSQSKTLELKLEQLIADLQSTDPEDKRKRELLESILKNKRTTTEHDTELRKVIDKFRMENKDSDFRIDIEKYYRHLLQ